VSANSDLIHRAFDAWNRNDVEEWLQAADPEIVFYPAGLFPDFDSVFHGRDGMMQFWDRLREPWDVLRAEVDSLDEEGDLVIVALRFLAHRDGAPAVDLALVTGFRIQDGLIIEMVTETTVEKLRHKLDC